MCRYLHARSPPVIHRDLKSPNLLMNQATHVVKVCDFGLSRCKEATATMTAIGTCQWTAPEVLRRDAYSEMADVWSMGVIVWELTALDLPFNGMTAIRVAAAVAYQGLRLEPVEGCPSPLADLMASCMADEPRHRPSFADLVTRLEALAASPDFAMPGDGNRDRGAGFEGHTSGASYADVQLELANSAGPRA